jgi:dihydroflavonol-4-reductase
MSRYLVTGPTGFLGAHLVDRLLAAGHEVVALCHRVGASADELRDRGATVRTGDILDASSVREAAAGCVGLYHVAGRVSRKPEDAELLFRVHVEGTKAVLDACRAAGVPRAVVASTSGTVAVSKRPDDVADERSPTPHGLLAPWPYYRSKLYAEKAALDRNAEGFEVVCVNPSILFGPGDRAGSSTGDLVKFLEQKIPVAPAGGLSFVDARDAAIAMELAMEKGRAGERYLVGAANMSFEAFFARLERISGVPAPKLTMPRSVRLASAGAELLSRAAKLVQATPPVDRISAEMGQHFWYLDASRARTELGWVPRDPSDTLADTVADLYARGVVWPRTRAS